MELSKPGQAREGHLNIVRERIIYKTALFDWCMRNAAKSMRRQKLNDALAWNECAGRVLSTSCVPLVSEELEKNLAEIARRLPVPEWQRVRDPDAPRRWLHVVDSFLPNGGHASMARRWMLSDPGNNVHNVALPFLENLPIPEPVVEASRQSGGDVFTPPAGSSLVFRAEWLRNLAFAKADYVVLHISSYNVVAPTAFGVDGGPPVLLTNHVAHVFWTGVPVVDLVLNCRGSQLECDWTEKLRVIPRAMTLPIPLLPEQTEGGSFSPEFRVHARRTLGVRDDEVVLLTVGRDSKYSPIPGVDFIQAAYSILESCPNTRIFVVGISPAARWQRASEVTQGRLVSVGRLSDLSVYQAAADVYLEGFPFGSTTALLEVGVHGVPCVLGPGECPPPFTTDGVAIDSELQRPATVAHYINAVEELVRDPVERRRAGESLARSIRAHHAGAGWRRYLAGLTRSLPERHAVHPVSKPQSPPWEIVDFWETYMLNMAPNELPAIFKAALFYNLQPRLDLRFCREYLKLKQFRRKEGRLQTPLLLALGILSPLCPARARLAFYTKLLEMGGTNGWITKLVSVLRRRPWTAAGLRGLSRGNRASQSQGLTAGLDSTQQRGQV